MLERFYQYAANQGLELIEGDKCFIAKSVSYLKEKSAREHLSEYIDIWLTAMGNEMIDYKKQNRGRFAANTKLRIRIFGN